MNEPLIATEFSLSELHTLRQALLRSASKTRTRLNRARRQASLESRPADSLQSELDAIERLHNQVTVIIGMNGR